MTANAIVEKLNAVIAKPIDSECKVVYVLCEVRKLLESIPANQRPWALNMYCHWALHVDLHGEDTIRSFLGTSGTPLCTDSSRVHRTSMRAIECSAISFSSIPSGLN